MKDIALKVSNLRQSRPHIYEVERDAAHLPPGTKSSQAPMPPGHETHKILPV